MSKSKVYSSSTEEEHHQDRAKALTREELHMHVKELPKKWFSLVFENPEMEKALNAFLLDRILGSKILPVFSFFFIATFMLMRLNYHSIGEGVPKSFTIYIVIMLAAVGVILAGLNAIALLRPSWASSRSCVHVSMFVILCTSLSHAILLIYRVHHICEPGEPFIFCSPKKGEVPFVHAFVLPVLVWYGQILSGGAYKSFTLLLAAINLPTLIYCVHETVGDIIAIGAGLQCSLVLTSIGVMNQQNMKLFEYHVAVSNSLREEVNRAAVMAELERKQLRMVLANVAHDMKTPLMAFQMGVHAIAQLIKRPDSGDSKGEPVFSEIESLVNDLDASCVFLTMQINRALDVTKIENKVKLLACYETVRIATVLKWAIGIMKSAQTRVEIVIGQTSNLLDKMIITDKGWLQENLLCLLSNAVKFSPADTCVSIHLSLASSHAEAVRDSVVAHMAASGKESPAQPPQSQSQPLLLVVEVEDHGIGVPPDKAAQLFKAFAQTQRRAGGTGLGLYSLALRIDELGGCYGIKAPSKHAGSVFYFGMPYKLDTNCLPVDNSNSAFLSDESYLTIRHDPPPPEEVHAEGHLAALYSRSNLRNLKSPSVLVVDDNGPALKLLIKALKQEGANVDYATDGYSALTMMKKSLYTMVIMDIQMPIMDGVESVRQLREWERSIDGDGRRQYVYGTSANPDEEISENCLGVGMDEFVLKPLSFPTLANKLRSLHHPL
jgi:signal transduction histidine kinase/CheY-like chemotaxis protein